MTTTPPEREDLVAAAFDVTRGYDRIASKTVNLIIDAIEPLVATRVRAQVAEEIAEAIQAPGDRAIYAWEAATIAREHARPAAGTDQPQEQPRRSCESLPPVR